MEARDVAALIHMTHTEAYKMNSNQTDKAYFYLLSGLRHLADTDQLTPENIAKIVDESQTWAVANIS